VSMAAPLIPRNMATDAITTQTGSMNRYTVQSIIAPWPSTSRVIIHYAWKPATPLRGFRSAVTRAWPQLRVATMRRSGTGRSARTCARALSHRRAARNRHAGSPGR